VTDFHRLQIALLLQGYRQGPPPNLKAEAVRIDRDILAEAECPACRRVGLSCKPYHRGRSYRVLGVCLPCGHAEEF
jgi:hypothetical protein